MIVNHVKQPDGGYRPSARDSDVGTLIIEVGDSKSIEALRRNVDTWFLDDRVSNSTLLCLNLTLFRFSRSAA